MAGKALRRAERRDIGPTQHRARGSLAIGRAAELKGEVEITSGGLVALGGLVSAVLLATTVLVRAAIRESRR